MWLVFVDAGWMIASGAIVGVILAGLSGQLIATFLFGVDPLDPLTFASVAVRDPAHRDRRGRGARLARQPHQPGRRLPPRRLTRRDALRVG